MLLPPHHHDAAMPQRPRTVGADIKPFFFTIVQIAEPEMQIADAAARNTALAGNCTIPLEEFVQRVYQRADIAAHISFVAFSALSAMRVRLVMPLLVPGGGALLVMRMLDARGSRRICRPSLAGFRRLLHCCIVAGRTFWQRCMARE